MIILNFVLGVELFDFVLVYCDFVMLNELEIEVIIGLFVNLVQDVIKVVEDLIRCGVRFVIIIFGENGCFFYDGIDVIYILVMLVGDVLEIIGVGDVFNGGFVVGLVQDMLFIEVIWFVIVMVVIFVIRVGMVLFMFI